MAILAHVLQLVGWWIAPLIIFMIKRESRFVSFHALQALLLQLAYMIVMGAFVVLWVASVFLTIGTQAGHQGGPPPPIIFLFPLVWLGFMGIWVVMLVVAIVYGIKAGRGEWAEYPLIGRLARKFLKIGPAGAFLEQAS
ncbi:MAG: hypothetical protein DMG68_14755 [Acidobacteria bacterium]|nr:MAG: hypothetical protein DMG68_14755 [Acidobacteriota bacterium]